MSTSARVFADPQNLGPNDRVRMMLFIAGDERNSQAARANLTRICERHLGDRADVEVVDVLTNHRKALEHRVLLTPAVLIFTSGAPARVTGTLEEPDRVLCALGLKAAGTAG